MSTNHAQPAANMHTLSKPSSAGLRDAKYLHLFAVPFMTNVWRDAGATGQRHAAANRSDTASSASFLPRVVPVHKEIYPVPGLMVVFPSYLPHAVHPHQGSRSRISIAFNFRNAPFP
jgi:hypothetical protein